MSVCNDKRCGGGGGGPESKKEAEAMPRELRAEQQPARNAGALPVRVEGVPGGPRAGGIPGPGQALHITPVGA